MLNQHSIFLGAPEQKTTGAGFTAPVGTTLPTADDLTKDGAELDAAFSDFGYVSEDGLTIGFGMSTGSIRDWGLNKVKTYLEEFDGTVSFSFMQSDDGSLILIVGEEYAATVAASATDGKKVTARFGARMAPAKSWVFKIKDGDARMLVVLPNAQVSTIEDVTVSATSAVLWNVSLSCNADANGDSIIIITDDGVVSKG